MPPEDIIDSYPLSPIQKGFFFQSQLEPDSSAYLLQLTGIFEEKLEPDLFWQAWKLVVDRHSILRTTFHTDTHGVPYQSVHAHVEIPVVDEDIRYFSHQEQQAYIQNYLNSEWRKGIDLQSPPLFRLALFRVEDTKYYFVRTIHHLLSDSRSSFLLYLELFSSYEAIRSGSKLKPGSARQYRDYIDWLALQDFSNNDPYWQSLLKGFHTPINLDGVLPSLSSLPENHLYDPDYESQSHTLSEGLSDQLKLFASSHGVTLNTILQGAWAILISRYSGENDVVFGATRNCRKSSFAGAENILGPMVNTLPVRAQLSENDTSIAFLRGLRDQWVAMRPYEHSPLTNIRAWADTPTNSRLFNTVVNYDHLSLNGALQAQSPAWKNRTFQYRQNPGYSLAFNGFGENKVILQLFYHRPTFGDEVIDRMLFHLENILSDMANNPERSPCKIQILNSDEQHQVLSNWNSTQREFDNTELVHRRVEGIAAKSPSSPAVIFNDEILTYGELNHRADLLAKALNQQGVRPGKLVAILMHRSPELIVALLAVLKAGAAYLPLDPENPAERLWFMLQEADPVLLLSQESFHERFFELNLPILLIDRDLPIGESISSSKPAPYPTAEDLAYVIYTSGSTGLPKGVEITHAGLVNLINWHVQEFQINSNDKATHLANISFDASVWEVWPYLALGAQVHLLSDEIELDPYRLINWFSRAGITISFLPTPLLETLLDMEWPDNLALRFILTGGDQLHRRPQHRLPFRLINNYGPTECTVVATSGEVLSANEVNSSQKNTPPDIGKPIANVVAYVLDNHLNPVPIGIPGELFLGGVGLARGYLKRPELTKEKFLTNPFVNDSQARLYRTGDMVRYRPDGELEFIGRTDTQIKVLGIRIELGEIEAKLNNHPKISRSVVLKIDRPEGIPYLVAFLEKTDNIAIDPEEFSQYLRTTLLEKMVPAGYIFLEDFPLTPNHKIDRQALSRHPSIDKVFSSINAQKTPPRNPIERAMVYLWSLVLGLSEIGIYDNFFSLGGNSLMAIRLTAQIEELFLVKIPLKTVFEASTPAALTERVISFAGQKEELERVADLFLHVINLSDSEAERVLSERNG